jgi:hypothetical protein
VVWVRTNLAGQGACSVVGRSGHLEEQRQLLRRLVLPSASPTEVAERLTDLSRGSGGGGTASRH